MRFAAVGFRVENNAVEPLFGRLANQLFRQRNMFLGGETKTADDAVDFGCSRLDALGDIHLLLARQQWDLAHLPEIHPDRVVQDIEPRLLVFFFRVTLFDAVHFRLIHDIDLQAAQLDVNLVEFLRPGEVVRQRVGYVAVGEVPLLVGEADQFFDLLGNGQRHRTFGRSLIGAVVRGVWRG